MEKESKKSKIVLVIFTIFLLFSLIGGGLVYINNLKQELAGSQSTVNALVSDVTSYKDKLGTSISEKELVLTNYKALQRIHAANGTEILRLQQLVKKNTLSATIIKTETKGHVHIKTELTFRDSSHVVTNDTIYPDYSGSVQNKWVNIAVMATKDSLYTDYHFFNEYEITQELKKEGHWPFRKQVPIVKVHNLNPYTETTGIASYAVQVPKKKGKVITITGVTFALGILTGIFLAK